MPRFGKKGLDDYVLNLQNFNVSGPKHNNTESPTA